MGLLIFTCVLFMADLFVVGILVKIAIDVYYNKHEYNNEDNYDPYPDYDFDYDFD